MKTRSIPWLDKFVGKKLKKFVYEAAKDCGENIVQVYAPIKAIFDQDGTIQGFTGDGEYVTNNGTTEYLVYDINQTFVINYLNRIVEE